MDTRDIAFALRELPIFAHLKTREIALLSMVMREGWFDDGEVICNEGDEGDSCYFVVAGAIAVTKRTSSGGQRRISTIGVGQAFGHVALIDEGPRVATIAAVGRTNILRLDRSDFDMLFQSGSQFALKFQESVARAGAIHLRRANRKLSALLAATTHPQAVVADRQALEEVQDILVGSATLDRIPVADPQSDEAP